MTDGNTLIVDVVLSGDGYMLNDTPVNMMIAYEVVRRHVTDNGTFYSQMTMKQKTTEGYVFKFDTGDEFTCTSDTAYPTAESVSDETGGGLGGGVLVVHDVNGTLDKTWQEIHDAEAAIISLSNNADSKSWYIVTGVNIWNGFFVSACRPGVNGKTGEPENDFRRYFTDSADGYPTAE